MSSSAADQSGSRMFATASSGRSLAPGLQPFLLNLLVLLAYFAAGRLGLAIPFTSGNVSPVWPPAGIAMAAVAAFGYPVLPGVFLGALLVNLFSPIPAAAAAGIACGSTLSAAAAAHIWRRAEFSATLTRLKDVLALLGIAGTCTALAASVGVTALTLSGVRAWASFGHAWVVWWLGDAMGVIILTPLLLAGRELFAGPLRRRLPELGLLAGGLLLTAFSIFDGRIGLGIADDVLVFAIFPFVLWAAVRSGVAGVAVSALLVSAVAIFYTAQNLGPFVRYDRWHNAALLQVFLAVLASTGLIVAAVVRERERAEDALDREQALLRERIAAEEALRRSQEQLKLAQAASRMGTWHWDVASGVVTWSDGIPALHGLSPAEFDGSFETWQRLVHPADRALVQQALEDALAGRRNYDLEFRTVWPDGSIHWIAARGEVLRNQEGKPVRMLGIGMDVTERRMSEQALRESEAKFRAVADTAATAIYIHDGARLLYVNRSAELITGYSREELLASDMWEMVHPEDREVVRQRALARFLGQPAPSRYEYRILGRDGSMRWLDFGAALVDFGGKRCILATALDITERKRAEEALRISERLATAGRMAATIAHEINNPLEAVTNLLYLIRNHPGLQPELQQYADLAQAEMGRVAHVARQTLAFYRESSSPGPTYLHRLLEEVLDLYASKIAAAGIRVERRYEFEGALHTFPGELRQVFSNFLLNAIDAVEHGGRLVVRVAAGPDWREPSRRGVRVTIADTGCGIAREQMPRVFDPFFTTKGKRGTGLGLWVSRGIVQKHGGSIRVRSSTAPGRSGTCFCAFFPFETAAGNDSAAEAVA